MSSADSLTAALSRGRRRIAAMTLVALGAAVTGSAALMPPAHAVVSVDFMQCSNDNPPDPTGDCFWINGIIQQNNSTYVEGMSVPQRLLFTDIEPTVDDVHTLTFAHDATKNGVHAYDWLTSYDQAVEAADDNGITLTLDECGEMISGTFETICQDLHTGGTSTTADVPDDPFVSANPPGEDYQSRIDAYEATYGNRTIEIFADAAISNATLSLVHDPAADQSDDGDSEIVYTLTWESASTDILIEMAGHLAVGDNGDDAWGAGLGASSINGGPYHFMLGTLDGMPLGSMDNQIQASAVEPRGEPELGRIFVEKQTDPDGSLQSFDFTASYDDDGFSLTDDGINNSGLLQPGVHSVAETVPDGWELQSAVCDDDDGDDPASINLEAGETVTCVFTNELEDEDDGYNQYPGDDDFDFDTPFDNDPDPQGSTNDDGGNDGEESEEEDELTVAGDTTAGDPAGDRAGGPAPAGTAPVALTELPRTGAGIGYLTMVAGLLIILGGSASLAGHRRRIEA